MERAGARQRPGENSTPFAGANRSRFEGLRSPALSAPGGAPLSWKKRYTRPRAVAARHCDNRAVILRLLRRQQAGTPSLLARVVAALVVVGMLGLAAPLVAAPVAAALRWLLTLL